MITNPSTELQDKSIKTIRYLVADAIQRANSGHPGLSMGAATIAYTLWTHHLNFNPSNPKWFNRDRVIIPGHGGMLLYSLLFLTGYDLNLDDLKSFRQWGSKAAGAPEMQSTPGVDVTTGPLGQSIANGVGITIAESHLSSIFNKPDEEIVNHFTYIIVTDGDLMEGISYESASLAGHLRLKKLILLYDDNKITIDGSTKLTFTEDIEKRFVASNWNVIKVKDGNDIDLINQAITKAKQSNKPTIIICRTVIGYGLPSRQGSERSHGEAPELEEVIEAKRQAKWPQDQFYVPEDVKEFFLQYKERGEQLEWEWRGLVDSYCKKYPDLGNEFLRRINREFPQSWDIDLPFFSADDKGTPTRNASGKIINHLSDKLPELIGGSADLASSNRTLINSSSSFQFNNYSNKNIYFGVREQAMGGIVNGISLHGGLIPFAGTFLVFFDYIKPAIRVGAISKIPSIWVFTHDSIGVGEDGPTHQPIEHLASLRSIPNLVEIRPADANEVTMAWKYAITRNDGPTAIILSRQSLPIIDRGKYCSHENLIRGAYILKDTNSEKPELILMASGSEVHLIIEAGEILESQGVKIRIISFPSWALFAQQNRDYQNHVLPKEIPLRLVVEAGSSIGWERWIGLKGDKICIDQFGKSAPGNVVFEKFGFSVNNIVEKALRLLDR